ncbi:MAG: ThuA domain-containing protein [Planctomycetota bacterium]
MPASRSNFKQGRLHFLLLLCLITVLEACAARPRVVFVTGDCEYRSEITMPMIAEILQSQHGIDATVCYATNPLTGEFDPKYRNHINNLAALRDADAAVFFMRFRELPDDQLHQILDYIKSGRPVVGIRTSTHAFAYPSGENEHWNDDFGKEVFGQKWISHHGHDSTTNVTITNKNHPVARGVAGSFHCSSWLYNVTPLPEDCLEIAAGAAMNKNGAAFGERNPVAWIRQNNHSRMFYTSLGHPSDFASEPVRRLLVNGILWALQRETDIPEEGSGVSLTNDWSPPPTH